MSNKPSDYLARKAAISPVESFIVQAPAGSGKTELLTDRILALLATVEQPEEIVAITFTRKAAAEMHARVVEKLKQGLEPEPQEAYKQASWNLARSVLQRNEELGWGLLNHTARLKICTIDAFCSYLTKAMPWLSALGGMPGITENPRGHYEAAAYATIKLIDTEPAVAQLLEHLDLEIETAIQMLADMLNVRDQWLSLLGQGANIDLLEQHLNNSVHKALVNLKELMPFNWHAELQPILTEAASNLPKPEHEWIKNQLQDWNGQPFDTDLDSVAAWQALAHMLLTGTGGIRSRLTVNEGFPTSNPDLKASFTNWLKTANATEPWVSALHEVRILPAGGYTAEQEQLLQALMQVLILALGHLQLSFAQHSEVDFIEISQRALRALGTPDNPTDLLLILDNQIRHILVDEFQDTSSSQIDLLARLTAGWEPDDGRTLFFVGDPMQSIYRFRKAEVGWFLRVQEQGLGNIYLQPLTLTENFRSQAKLVNQINMFFKPVFPSENNADLGAISYTESIPFNSALDVAAVQFYPVPDFADNTLHSRIDEQVVKIAKQAYNSYKHTDKPLAILVRSRNNLNDVVKHISSAGLPCRAVELVSLASRQVVIDLAQLARALSHPDDRLAWLSVLRSPLCGLSLASLHALFGHDHNATVPYLLGRWFNNADNKSADIVLAPGEATRLRMATEVLLNNKNQSGSLPFAAWLELCWQRLNGPAIYPNSSDSADVQSVLRLVEKLAPYGQLDLAEFELALDKLYAESTTSGPAIEVMTIHRAKGLEFEAVIVMGLCRTPRPEKPPLIYVEQSHNHVLLGPVTAKANAEKDHIATYLAAQEKKRNEYEQDRLLYVALTRARSELHLIGSVKIDENGKAKIPDRRSFLARLWNNLDYSSEQYEVPEQLEPVGADQQSQRYLVRPTLQSLEEFKVAQAEQPDYSVPVFEGLNVWHWNEASSTEALLGTVAHAWLERIGTDGLDAWPAVRIEGCTQIFHTQLSRAGVLPEHIANASEILTETLLATIESNKGRWLLQAAQAYREWSLLDLDGRVSIIDLAISDDQGWLVVDYKTSAPRAGESHENFAQRMVNTYSQQINKYCQNVSAIDGREARGVLFCPRVNLWIDI